MPLFDVNIFPVFSVKLTAIEAANQKEAVEKAIRGTSFSGSQVRPVESEYDVDYAEYADNDAYYLVRDNVPSEAVKEPDDLHDTWFNSGLEEMTLEKNREFFGHPEAKGESHGA